MILQSFSDFFQFLQILETFSHTDSHTNLRIPDVYWKAKYNAFRLIIDFVNIAGIYNLAEV